MEVTNDKVLKGVIARLVVCNRDAMNKIVALRGIRYGDNIFLVQLSVLIANANEPSQ